MDSNRREFLKGASAAATVVTATSYSRIMGANERIRLALIGCGGRGTSVMTLFQNNPFIQVVGVCDIYEEHTRAAQQKASGAAMFKDHRAVLARNDVDAVQIATPDHWHTAIAIDALNAGKDVYVEKPLTRLPEEGPAIVKAARENNRVCQVGMQQRSGKHYLEAKEKYFDSGQIGDITLARTWWHGNSWHLRKAPASLATKPADLDWNRSLEPVIW